MIVNNKLKIQIFNKKVNIKIIFKKKFKIKIINPQKTIKQLKFNLFIMNKINIKYKFLLFNKRIN